MAVIGATLTLGVRRRRAGVDAHGTPVAGVLGEAGEWMPGRIVRRPDVDGDVETGPGGWVLAVDASWWPVAAGDQVVEQGGAGRVWTVVRASHRPSDFDPSIDYVRMEASLAE
ncbi:hypothetical protein GCM10027187_39760 [Streptosporangium sandarakinum]|uniref:Uncharacterized protein n=1 Tax=Streptosporangium sandarakinum TaxID=1260955 RepID=A0A852VBT1_9ACTN|nr:hypothetical protein [Streptosporangium sandarakinum]NYF44693.1 hypothetical protein [Streptosporangium sandarakinum]